MDGKYCSVCFYVRQYKSKLILKMVKIFWCVVDKNFWIHCWKRRLLKTDSAENASFSGERVKTRQLKKRLKGVRRIKMDTDSIFACFRPRLHIMRYQESPFSDVQRVEKYFWPNRLFRQYRLHLSVRFI